LILQNIDSKFLFHGNHLLNRLLAGTPTTAEGTPTTAGIEILLPDSSSCKLRTAGTAAVYYFEPSKSNGVAHSGQQRGLLHQKPERCTGKSQLAAAQRPLIVFFGV
jgi:hypothetical protein